jgi:long-chain acyl-CoA synthetase
MKEQTDFNDIKNMIKKDLNWQAHRMLYRAAHAWPSKTALLCGEEAISFSELYNSAAKLTKKLQNNVTSPQNIIVIMYENSISFYIAYWAAWQTGAIVAPLNTYLHENEVKITLNNAQPNLILASLKQQKKLPETIGDAVMYDESHIIRTETEHAITIPERDPHECRVILYTSGTTGTPKGVMLSSHNILTNVAQGTTCFEINHHERVYASLPLFHSFMQNACIWTPMLLGATTIVIPRVARHDLLTGLAHSPTIILGIPQLYGLFCKIAGATFPHVKLFISGGDALPDKIRMGFELLYRRKICNGYGLTETAPFLAVDGEGAAVPTSTIGRALPGIEVSIRDDKEHTLAPNEIGVLWVKGDNIMLGYFNAPDATDAIIKNGWLNTGDLATIDDHGNIVLCGRAKDLIVHKGFNIYPQEIENVLMSHTDVIMAGVIGEIQNNEEIPVAYVASQKKPETLIPELRELCKQHLAAYKIPRTFHVQTNLPTTSTGKVDKKSLKNKNAKS